MGFWDGNSEESLFYKPMVDSFSKNDLNDFNHKIADIKDERLHAIVSGLVVETLLDRFLSLLMPKYDKYLLNKDVNFSTKINILKAFAIIPVNIINCADCVRQVRNEFAHNLEKVKFEDLEDKIRNQIIGIYGNIYQKKNENLFECFRNLIFYYSSGIDLYMTNLSVLNSIIRSKEFIENISNEFQEKNYEALKQMSDLEPGAVLVVHDNAVVAKGNEVFEIYKLNPVK